MSLLCKGCTYVLRLPQALVTGHTGYAGSRAHLACSTSPERLACRSRESAGAPSRYTHITRLPTPYPIARACRAFQCPAHCLTSWYRVRLSRRDAPLRARLALSAHSPPSHNGCPMGTSPLPLRREEGRGVRTFPTSATRLSASVRICPWRILVRSATLEAEKPPAGRMPQCSPYPNAPAQRTTPNITSSKRSIRSGTPWSLGPPHRLARPPHPISLAVPPSLCTGKETGDEAPTPWRKLAHARLPAPPLATSPPRTAGPLGRSPALAIGCGRDRAVMASAC
jgi:hypothetical protein